MAATSGWTKRGTGSHREIVCGISGTSQAKLPWEPSISHTRACIFLLAAATVARAHVSMCVRVNTSAHHGTQMSSSDVYSGCSSRHQMTGKREQILVLPLGTCYSYIGSFNRERIKIITTQRIHWKPSCNVRNWGTKIGRIITSLSRDVHCTRENAFKDYTAHAIYI